MGGACSLRLTTRSSSGGDRDFRPLRAGRGYPARTPAQGRVSPPATLLPSIPFYRGANSSVARARGGFAAAGFVAALDVLHTLFLIGGDWNADLGGLGAAL